MALTGNSNCTDNSIPRGDTTSPTPYGIRVQGDTDIESDETVIVTISLVSAPAGVTLGTSTVTHTILDDDTPTEISVAPDWPLTPSGLSGGDSFRLLFVTSTTRNASATDIATYNSFVQTAAKAGHSGISDDVGDGFAAVASTSAVDARDNTATTGAGVPIYWLGGDQVADGYADFYDGSWDDYAATNESGTTVGGSVRVWTGSNDDGTKHATNYLGNTNVQAGDVGAGSDPFTSLATANSNGYRLYGLSPVFTVVAPPEISVELPTGEGESRTDAGEKKVDESEGGVGIGFPLKADQTLATALTVCVRVTETVGARVASGDEGLKEVSLTSSGMNVGNGTHTLRWTNTAADDRDSSVTVEIVPPDTASCSADDGSYTVSSSDGSDKVLIQDDEATTVSLTSSDMTMTEGDATDTATLTVSLSRRLYDGEIIAAPIALATSTGARLPNNATPDFTVAATGTQVTLAADAPANTPRLVFTGHDTNTVQTATVTLTPVANRDDPDSTAETITATLTGVEGTGLGTTVSGGAAAHGTNNAATLSLVDDEAAPAGTPGITFRSVSDGAVLSRTMPLRLLETGSAQYTIVLDAEPTHDVRVNVSGSSVGLGSDADAAAVTVSPHQLTFTTVNWNQPQTVTVTGVDEPNRHRNRTLWLTNGANSTDTRYEGLSSVLIRTWVDDAPEVEAWWDFKGRLSAPAQRVNVRGEGAPEATQNAAPFHPMSYVVRVSNRPGPGGTVTVTATSSDFSKFGLSLTKNGPVRSSLTLTFEDREPAAGTGCGNWIGLRANEYFDSGGNIATVTGGGDSETWDSTAATPWECWRRVYVIRRFSYRSIANTCVDITHTASGGGVRRVAIDTVRAHVIDYGLTGGRGCGWLVGNTLPAPQNSPLPAQAPPVPTEAVANLSVTDGGGTAATAAWDAVPHADKYSVSYSAQAADGSLTQTAGAFDDITATSLTFDYGVAAPATVTVTVTPGYDNDDSGGGGARR